MTELNMRQDRSEYLKNYYTKHRDEILAKKKEGRHITITCECGKDYKKYSKSSHVLTKQHQEHIKKNPPATLPKISLDHKEYCHQYYLKHKEAFIQRSKNRVQQKIICDCGGRYCSSSRATHFRSNKHTNYIQNNVLY
jgi:hypothetical protein